MEGCVVGAVVGVVVFDRIAIGVETDRGRR